MTPNWRNSAPAAVLDAYPLLTVGMVGHELIDPEQPLHRWHVTSDEVRRYSSRARPRGGRHDCFT